VSIKVGLSPTAAKWTTYATYNSAYLSLGKTITTLRGVTQKSSDREDKLSDRKNNAIWRKGQEKNTHVSCEKRKVNATGGVSVISEP